MAVELNAGILPKTKRGEKLFEAFKSPLLLPIEFGLVPHTLFQSTLLSLYYRTSYMPSYAIRLKNGTV